jgi:hypothetical protein
MNAGQPQPNVKGMQLVLGAVPLTPIILAIVLFVIRIEGRSEPTWEDPLLLYGVFTAIGVGLIPLSWFVRNLLAARIPSDGVVTMTRFQAALIGAALCEVLAILGFVADFIAGELGASLLMIGVSFVAMVAHFPRAAWLRGEQ